MRAFLSIFRLELLALARSRSLLLLALAALGWMFAFPHLVTSDGTVEGARELYVHYALGGAFACFFGQPGLAQMGGVEQRGRKRGAQLVRQTGDHLAHCRQPLVALCHLAHGVGFGDVVQQHDGTFAGFQRRL